MQNNKELADTLDNTLVHKRTQEMKDKFSDVLATDMRKRCHYSIQVDDSVVTCPHAIAQSKSNILCNEHLEATKNYAFIESYHNLREFQESYSLDDNFVRMFYAELLSPVCTP